MISVNELSKQLKMPMIEVKKLLQSHGIEGKREDSILTEKEIQKLVNGLTNANKSEHSATRDLEELFGENTRAFIDTNILLEDNFYEFWNRLEPVIIRHRSISTSRLPIIPFRVCDELIKMAQGEQNERAKKAGDVVRYVRQLKDKQLVKIMGDPNSDNFADNVFKTVFTQKRLQYNMVLVTQDKALTEDILQLNNSKADKANKVRVFKLKKDSTLADAEKITVKKPGYSFEAETPMFEIKKTPISRPDVPLKAKSFPKVGEDVYTSKGAVRLISVVSETGGEGMVYRTENGDICKIYHPSKLSLNRKEKIELMVKKRISHEGICWPTEVVYNSNKEFVGYLMPEAKGKELNNLFLKPLLAKNFPDWTKRETVQLCITILEKINYLHHHNIIMGDLNPRNVLVVSPKEVYFVDCDSYQLNKYPCEVDVDHFRAPELIGKDMSKQMRTLGNESFAIATLLFMIMIPGKPPYAQTGSGTPEEDIAKMIFAYPKGAEKKGVVAPGHWRFCWSHLSYDIKEAFYNTFQGGEVYSKEEDRLSSRDWLEKMKKYAYVLEKLIENDEQSGWIFPTDYKKIKDVPYATCVGCNKSVKEEDLTEGYCKSCLHDNGEVYHCGRCNKEMIYSNFQRLVKKKPKYNECYECRQELDSVVKEIECRACGESFDFTLGEKEYYDSKGYEEPKRCQTCRDNNVPVRDSSKYIKACNMNVNTKIDYANNIYDVPDYMKDKKKDAVNGSVLEALRGIWSKFK